MHRRIAFGVALTALLIGPALAATAAPPAVSRSASASWALGDALDTKVSLQGSVRTTGDPGDLFLLVSQRFCDSATNELVIRGFSIQQPLDKRHFKVDPHLRSAAMQLRTMVKGSEFRSANCAVPTGPPVFTDLGFSSVTVLARWVGSGPVYAVQPGITGRAATASGAITGSVVSPGSLGHSQAAELRETTQ